MKLNHSMSIRFRTAAVLLWLLLFSFFSCKKTEVLPSPEISGNFDGLLTVQIGSDSFAGSGSVTITVKELSDTSVEISGPDFTTFTISGMTRSKSTSSSQSNSQLFDQWRASSGDNSFSYFGGNPGNELQFNWKTTVGGKVQRVQFAGRKK